MTYNPALTANTAFLGLDDTPGSFAGQGSKVVSVNAGETALEFAAVSTDFLSLTDTPGSFAGQGSRVVSVNAGETALEFTTPSGDGTLGSLVDYKLTEQELPQLWTDGKPIHKKTISVGPLPNSTSKNVAHGITNIERIVKMEAFSRRSGTGVMSPQPFVVDNFIGTQVLWQFNTTNIFIRTAIDQTVEDEVFLTLYYTRSDVTSPVAPISIPTTPQLVDYKLTEQELAQLWTDGSPVHKKTINFGALPNAATKNVAHAITNLGVLIEVEAVARNTSTNMRLTLPWLLEGTATNNVKLQTDNTNIVVATTLNFSVYDECYITLYYTRTDVTNPTVSAVGGPLNFSTSEQATGQFWIDNKPIFQKTISFGALPNATSKSVAHGITGFERLIEHRMNSRNSGTNLAIPLPFVHQDSQNNNISLIVDATNVTLDTNTNQSANDECHITLFYTKT